MFTQGELNEIAAGIRPSAVPNTKTFDAGVASGALAAKAVATTALTGTNNDMTFTAEANGVAGNSVSIEYRDPGQGGMAIHTSVEDSKNIIVSLKTSAGVKAVSTLTQTTADVSVDDTVTIGTTVYRFKSTMLAAYDVKIGVSAAVTLDNLKAAINASGTPGTEYFAGTLIHPTVTATTNAADSQVIETKVVGVAGNSVATTSTAANLAWTSTVMASGEDVGQILSLASEVKTSVEASTVAAALVDVANYSTDTGAGVVTAMDQSFLAGGSDGKVPLYRVTGAIICSLRGYVATSLTGTNATLVHGVTGTTNMLIPILTSTTLVAPKGIDKSAAVVARGTALDKVPLWLVQDEDIFATTATAATTAGKINYLLDYIAVTPGASVEAL